MARTERLIKIAFDKSTGELVNAADLFDESKVDSFAVRKEFQSGKNPWNCCECGQDLNISVSRYDRLYFKHKFPHDFCMLTDGNLSPKEQEDFARILVAKESERHKELKHKIGNLLQAVPGIDTTSISVDSKFIMRDHEKRKPDVYCQYLDKELVFEIQLSDLSLGYILSRYSFYKKHGMFLIWILDNFDIHNQGTLERDIKYLTEYQNFFKLDESATSFKLVCDYKFPFITDDDKVFTKWLNRSVSLDELKFDDDIRQMYYFNYSLNKLKVETDLKEKIEEKDLLKKKKAEELANTIADEKATSIISLITARKSSDSLDYSDLHYKVSVLNDFELGILNCKLDLVNRQRDGMPILSYWIKNSTQKYDFFLQFLFSCKAIELRVNYDVDTRQTLFQELLHNENLYNDFIIKLLLKRGYTITKEDENLYQRMAGVDMDRLLLYRMCSWLSDKSLVDDVFKYYQLLYTLQSAAGKKIVGYRFDNWVSLANNAIQHHSKYWEYIEMAFKKYAVWDLIMESDKKGTFQKKLSALYSNMPQQNYDFDDVFRDLYPELEYLELE